MSEAAHPERELPEVVEALGKSFKQHQKLSNVGRTPLPSRDAIADILSRLEELVFPGYVGRQELTWETVSFHLGSQVDEVYAALSRQIFLCIRHTCRIAGPDSECSHCVRQAAAEAMTFLKKLPTVREFLELDLQALYDGDPAARSLDEIIFSYPGMKAITIYRLAHELFGQKIPLMPRIMTEIAHNETGIDIHPGATIGRSFFIDHGTGVVIGETTQIGDNVKLYQGTTLGALSFPKDERGEIIRGRKRHPTIEDNVTVYSGATILGGDTVVGKGSVVGGNVWLTHSVPPGTRVIVEAKDQKITDAKGKQIRP